MAASAEDIRWMRSALVLSKRGLGQVWPNPSVGCIIVKDGIVLGRGVTAAGGRPHAEAAALAQAGPAAIGATAYVTLEPCGRPGRDHSCADKLIEAGVARVVAAVIDPNPQVNGHGLDRLRGAGIAAECGVLENQAREIHAGFFSRISNNRPMLTLKLAASLDGKIAAATGESRWITGPLARRHAHALRVSHDAILVGSNTVVADDPMLDVRDLGIAQKPVRIVLDSNLQISASARLVQTAKSVPLWIVHGPKVASAKRQTLLDSGAKLFACPLNADGRVDLELAFSLLADQGLTRILCEGGSRMAAALISAGLVDNLVVFSAGKIIGAEGLASIGVLGSSALPQKSGFQLVAVTDLGGDSMMTWKRS